MSEQDTHHLVLSATPKEQSNNRHNPSSGSGSRDVTLDFIFLAKTDNARIISQILSTLYMKKDQVNYLFFFIQNFEGDSDQFVRKL
jgi:hypothetical protein